MDGDVGAAGWQFRAARSSCSASRSWISSPAEAAWTVTVSMIHRMEAARTARIKKQDTLLGGFTPGGLSVSLIEACLDAVTVISSNKCLVRIYPVQHSCQIYNFSTTRSFALRARGLSLISSSPASMRVAVDFPDARFVPAGADRLFGRADAVAAFTAEELLDQAVFQRVEARSPPACPPGASAATACGRTASTACSSWLTAMRRAWKVRVAG